MTIINAVWEKRNLGIDTVEFNISEDDSIEEIKKCLIENEKKYSIVRLPANCFEYHILLSEMGYCFAETNFHLICKTPNLSLTKMQERLTSCVSVRLIQDEMSYNILFDEIQRGIFKTDRIALDPFFSIEIANKRYIGWIRDEIERGAEIYILSYKNNDIGFIALKDLGNNKFNAFLGGLYLDYTKSGLGINLAVQTSKIICEKGGGSILTNVSSNNKNSLAVDLAFGYLIDDINYIFVKHK